VSPTEHTVYSGTTKIDTVNCNKLSEKSVFQNTPPCNEVGGCTHAATKFDRYGFTTPNAHLHRDLYNYARE